MMHLSVLSKIPGFGWFVLVVVVTAHEIYMSSCKAVIFKDQREGMFHVPNKWEFESKGRLDHPWFSVQEELSLERKNFHQLNLCCNFRTINVFIFLLYQFA